jgi:hypothetical protein
VYHLLAQGREASAPDELFGVSEQLAAALAWADDDPDLAMGCASEHIATLAAAVREYNDVLGRTVRELENERERRVAAQEAITLHWEGRVERAEAALAEVRGIVTRHRDQHYGTVGACTCLYQLMQLLAAKEPTL